MDMLAFDIDRMRDVRGTIHIEDLDEIVAAAGAVFAAMPAHKRGDWSATDTAFEAGRVAALQALSRRFVERVRIEETTRAPSGNPLVDEEYADARHHAERQIADAGARLQGFARAPRLGDDNDIPRGERVTPLSEIAQARMEETWALGLQVHRERGAAAAAGYLAVAIPATVLAR